METFGGEDFDDIETGMNFDSGIVSLIPIAIGMSKTDFKRLSFVGLCRVGAMCFIRALTVTLRPDVYREAQGDDEIFDKLCVTMRYSTNFE